MSFTSYGNVSTTRSCTTNSNQASCTVGLYPAAVGVWGTAGASFNGSTGVPTIATTRFYLDPSTNATVSSSVICNWEQYSSAYVVPGKNASEAGYYTVNSDCALVGVLRRDQELNWQYPAISATYPNPKLDLGSKFETWYNTCPTSTGLPEQTTTTSIVYSDAWSQKFPMPFYWMPELSNYLTDVTEVTSCSIYLYGSPQTLKPASHLTENVLLPRSTTAAQPADTPQPEAPQTTQPNTSPQTSTANPVPISAQQPKNEPATPQQPSPPPLTPTANTAGTSPTNSPEGGDTPAQDEDEEEDPSPIDQDPIWSAIGDAAEQASGTAPAPPPQAGASSSPDNADQSHSDSVVPIVSQPQASSDLTGSDSDSANTNSGSGNDENAAVSPAGQGNANLDDDTNTGSVSSNGGTSDTGDLQSGGASGAAAASTAATSENDLESESGTDEAELRDSANTGNSPSGDEGSSQGIVLGSISGQIDITSSAAETNGDSPGSSNALPGGQADDSPPTSGTALTFAGPEATPAVTLVPIGDSSSDAIESIVAAGSVSFVDGAVVIGSQTVQPGGPAVTISGEEFLPVVSIAAETRSGLVITVPGTSGLQAVTFSANSGILASQVQSLISQGGMRATDGGFVVASRTLLPGGSAVTISEQDATYVVSLPTAPSGGPLGTIAVSKMDDTQAEDLGGYICSVVGGCANQIPTAEESSRAVASLGTSTDRASRTSSNGTTRTTENAATSSTTTSDGTDGETASSDVPSDSGARGKRAGLGKPFAAIAAGMFLSLLTHFA